MLNINIYWSKACFVPIFVFFYSLVMKLILTLWNIRTLIESKRHIWPSMCNAFDWILLIHFISLIKFILIFIMGMTFFSNENDEKSHQILEYIQKIVSWETQPTAFWSTLKSIILNDLSSNKLTYINFLITCWTHQQNHNLRTIFQFIDFLPFIGLQASSKFGVI